MKNSKVTTAATSTTVKGHKFNDLSGNKQRIIAKALKLTVDDMKSLNRVITVDMKDNIIYEKTPHKVNVGVCTNTKRYKYAADCSVKELKAVAEQMEAKAEIGKSACATVSSPVKEVVVYKDMARSDRDPRYESTRFNNPDNYNRLEAILCKDPSKTHAEATIELDTGKISPVITHLTRPDDNIASDRARLHEYRTEAAAIRRSCDQNAKIRWIVKETETTAKFMGKTYMFAIDAPVAMLENIQKEMKMLGTNDYKVYNAYKEKHPTHYTVVQRGKTFSKRELVDNYYKLLRLCKKNGIKVE